MSDERSYVGDDFDSLRQRRQDLSELLLQRLGDREDVASLLHDGDAADDFTLAVEVGDAPAQVVAHLQVPDVSQVDGLPGLVAAEHQVFELVEVVGVDRPAQLVLAVRDLDGAAARLLERRPERR